MLKSREAFVRFKNRLADREPVFGLVLRSPDTAMAEVVAYSGFDFAWVDMEHTSLGLRDVEHQIVALENAGCIPLVRVPYNHPQAIGNVLDMGARIVNVPHVDTAKEAQAVVHSAKYFPAGRRGIATCTRSNAQGRELLDGKGTRKKNAENMVMVQLESTKAVCNVDSISNVDGVDILFVGAGDLCQDLGIPGEPQHPKCGQAIEKVGQALRRSGKIGAIAVNDFSRLQWYGSLGFNMICCGVDTMVMKKALDSLIKKAKRQS